MHHLRGGPITATSREPERSTDSKATILARRYDPEIMLPFATRLIVEPDDGSDPVREFINAAENSLLIKQFTSTEAGLIDAVIERQKAGVDVRVMLNARRSGGDRANDATFEKFRSAGIAVQWSNQKFYVTHEKSIVADEKAALVATFNLCTKYFT